MIDIERFMSSMKITQADLADKLGVSQAAISKVKNGKMDFPKNWIEIIQKEYNQDITSYITDGIQTPIASEPIEPYQTLQKKLADEHQYLSIISQLASSNEILARSVEKMAESINKITEIKIQKMERELV